MKRRQILIVVGAVVIFMIAKLISAYLETPAERNASPRKTSSTTVFSRMVSTSQIPVVVEATGMIEAIERMELYSEVQGVMLPDGGRFKAGNEFSNGEVLVSLRADDILAQLVSQRSGYERLVTGLMPDLKLDYPDDYPTWQSYLSSLDVNSPIPELPIVSSEKLKLFLTGRNVYTEFYAIRNSEIGYSKYRLRAPYRGVLSEANIDPGTVVRQGQKLGVLIRPGVYEVRVPADQAIIKWIEKGQLVELARENDPKEKHQGTVSRVNRSIDPQSQMSEFFVKVNSEELKDGMFVQVKASTKEVSEAMILSRSILFDSNKLFLVENGALKRKEVEIVHFYQDSVIVRGLSDGMQVLSILPPGAFEGMEVSIFEEIQAQ